MSQAKSCEDDLERYNAVGNSLKTLLSQYRGNTRPIERRVTQLNAEYRKLFEQLATRLADVHEVWDQAREFTMIVDDVYAWLVILRKDIDVQRNTPVERDVHILKGIIEDYEVFLTSFISY